MAVEIGGEGGGEKRKSVTLLAGVNGEGSAIDDSGWISGDAAATTVAEIGGEKCGVKEEEVARDGETRKSKKKKYKLYWSHKVWQNSSRRLWFVKIYIDFFRVLSNIISDIFIFIKYDIKYFYKYSIDLF